MPRLLPRLIRKLENARTHPQKPFQKPTPSKQLPKPSPASTKTRPDPVDLTAVGRRKSILLDRDALRLIYRHARYKREKALAPEVRVSRSRWEAKQRHGRAPPGVVPREMTKEERSFWANPYLRMFSSPMRRCLESGWLLPRDLMIRMTPSLIPGDKSKSVFLPAGLEHPRFRRYRGGKSRYIICWKYALEVTQRTGAYKRMRPEYPSEFTMHPLIQQQIGHALRVRVLHELQVLARRLRRRQQPSLPTLIRRLTRAEWKQIKSSRTVPFENAVAILVVPPLNRDPKTKERPAPNFTSVPTSEDLKPELASYTSQPFPLSEMLHTTKDTVWTSADERHMLPPVQVPLYNGVTMFPSRTQRAALYCALSDVLKVESTARLRRGIRDKDPTTLDPSGFPPGRQRRKGDDQASHAILVCSDEKTLLRGDTVPLAVALWRIQMWENGPGGVEDSESLSDWILNPLPSTA